MREWGRERQRGKGGWMRGQCTGATIRREKCGGLMRGYEKAAAAYNWLEERIGKWERRSGEEDGRSGREVMRGYWGCERKDGDQAKVGGERGNCLFSSVLSKSAWGEERKNTDTFFCHIRYLFITISITSPIICESIHSLSFSIITWLQRNFLSMKPTHTDEHVYWLESNRGWLKGSTHLTIRSSFTKISEYNFDVVCLSAAVIIISHYQLWEKVELPLKQMQNRSISSSLRPLDPTVCTNTYVHFF